MEITDILTAISTVGFPIVVAIIMIYYNYKQSENHKEEMSKLNESLNNNTIALAHLTDKLDTILKGE